MTEEKDGTNVDLSPAAAALTRIIEGIEDAQLAAPTPCQGVSVGWLLDHVDGLCVAFTAAATKHRLPGDGAAPVPDPSRLGDDWRKRLPDRIAELADAWLAPTAWTGSTYVGGGPLPAETAGAVALNEIVIHGWDLAVATGQPYPADDPTFTDALRSAHGWVSTVVEQAPDGTPGLFGAPVSVPAHAPLLDQLVGLTGRDPAWQPSRQPVS